MEQTSVLITVTQHKEGGWKKESYSAYIDLGTISKEINSLDAVITSVTKAVERNGLEQKENSAFAYSTEQ